MLVSTTVVSTHLPSPNHALLLSDLDQPPMQFRDHLPAERLCDPRQRLGVRHLAQTDAGEVTESEVHSYLTLQHIEAPVADMLEQETQNHFGRCLRPAFGGTVFMP